MRLFVHGSRHEVARQFAVRARKNTSDTLKLCSAAQSSTSEHSGSPFLCGSQQLCNRILKIHVQRKFNS